MSKRFTDTDKWEDVWFRNLSPDFQRLWIYLLDRCDQSGVWEVDFELTEFFLKTSFVPSDVLLTFKDRVFAFDGGKKWFIPKFISFQYGTLNEHCKPHAFVLRLLKSYKIEGYLKGIHTLKDKDKDQDKDQDKEKKGVPPPKSFHQLRKKLAGKLNINKKQRSM